MTVVTVVTLGDSSDNHYSSDSNDTSESSNMSEGSDMSDSSGGNMSDNSNSGDTSDSSDMSDRAQFALSEARWAKHTVYVERSALFSLREAHDLR